MKRLALILALLASSASANATYVNDYGELVSCRPQSGGRMLVCLNLDTGDVAFCVPVGNGRWVACQ